MIKQVWIRAQRFKIWWYTQSDSVDADLIWPGWYGAKVSKITVSWSFTALELCKICTLTSHGELKQDIIGGLQSIPQKQKKCYKVWWPHTEASHSLPSTQNCQEPVFQTNFDTKLTNIWQPTDVDWNSQINLPFKLWTFFTALQHHIHIWQKKTKLCGSQKTWASKGPTLLPK